MPSLVLRPISEELEGADLGDVRLNRRLGALADALAAMPSVGLPRACRTTAALEGAYRFLSNTGVEPQMILEPHLTETRNRAVGQGAVLAIHDTTEFGFGGETRGHLGRTNNDQAGFFAHVTLGLRAADREPLGLLNCQTWARRTKESTRKERATVRYRKRADKASNRWTTGVDQVEEAFEGVAGVGPLIHVVDREGDQYRLVARIIEHRSHFIVRSFQERRLATGENIWEATAKADVVFEREVRLSRRRPKHGRASHGPREGRSARLAVSASTVDIRRSKGPVNRGAPPSLSVNVVRVIEIDPPDGEEPVEWNLLTNLPIDTREEIAFVVDCYRARWTIEEFFKAVKTGCAYEKLQLENERALRNALAIIMPIAWRMLLVRYVARGSEPMPAEKVLTKTQIEVLRNTPWTTLPKRPSAKDALCAIATLGGHIRNNGEPGWQVLYAGLRDLMLLEVGWRARSDQS